MKKRISVDLKLGVLVLFAALVPTLWANYLFYKARAITRDRGAILGVSNMVGRISQVSSAVIEAIDNENERAEENIAQERRHAEEQLVTYLDREEARLKQLDSAIRVFETQRNTFMFGTALFAAVAVFAFLGYLATLISPMKETVGKLILFKKEDPTKSDFDILECSERFEEFLHTTRTILSETHALSRELLLKIEPMTNMSAFSDETVGHFFTDVQEISRSSNYIANTIESTAASIEEVSTSAQTIADRSHKAAQNSSETAQIAADGRNAVTETVATMQAVQEEVLELDDVIESLNSASKQIAEIVNTITNIAYQTNLLALNAAIEAARAGEHGQGFAVVADEVRKLAEESGEAAEDIGKKIKGMLQKTGNAVETINKGKGKVNDGVKVANLAGSNLSRIVSSVNNVNLMIQDISKASSEQSNNVESLRTSIESISGATRITSDGTKRVAGAVTEQLNHIRQYVTATRELHTLVQVMQGMLDKFNFS